MGKQRKIEIDDRMPCSEHEELIIATTDNLNELWILLLTKAIIKLYYYKCNKDNYIQSKIGDGAILYSLLGYASVNIGLESLFKNIKLLNHLIKYNDNQIKVLNNKKINSNKKFHVICYNSIQDISNISNDIIKNKKRKIIKNKDLLNTNLSNTSKENSINFNKKIINANINDEYKNLRSKSNSPKKNINVYNKIKKDSTFLKQKLSFLDYKAIVNNYNSTSNSPVKSRFKTSSK